MKHLLNNMTETEKNSIREQHVGGMKVMTENFTKLLNSKLGDVKPITENEMKESMMTKDSIKSGASNLAGCFDPKKYPNLAKVTRGSLKTIWGMILMQGGISGELLSFGLSTPLSAIAVVGGVGSTTVGLKKIMDANKGLIDDELKALAQCVFG